MTQVLYRQTMKTSSRISLQFTLWIAIISGILLGILNSVFMYGWITSETQNITQYVVLKNIQPRNPYTDTLQRQERVMAFSETTFRPEDLASFRGIKRFRLFDGRWWIVGKSSNYYVLFDVSQNINRQLGLLSISAISWLGVVFISFIFGRLFVKKSLRDLRILAKKVRDRDVTKNDPITLFEHLPNDDEINKIAKSIQNLENRIQLHYGNLRQFVGNVSHELKTPLMVMSTEIDIAKKTKNYDELLVKLKSTFGDMQSIVDTLLTLTRLQAQDNIEKKDININQIIDNITENIKKKYKDTFKNIVIHQQENNINTQKGNDQLVKILLNNIIDNAHKYSPENSEIQIHTTIDKIEVRNTGSISEEIIENMRTQFWQADKNRGDGVGIGLSLVQEIIRLHDWKIEYSSEDNMVICTVYFNNI